MLFAASTVVLALGALLADAQSVPKAYDDYVVHERRHSDPTGWHRVERAADVARLTARGAKDAFILPVRINLVQPHLEDAHEKLMDISSPDSPNYGEHLSHLEVASLFAPAEDAIAEVLAWLAASGLPVSRSKHYDPLRGAILVDMPMSHAEELLHAKYELYEHHTSTPHVACTEYHVPASLAKHIDFITPTTHFDANPRKHKKKGQANVAPSSGLERHREHRHDGLHQPVAGKKRSDVGPRPGKLRGGGANPVGNKFEMKPLAAADPESVTNCDQRITPGCLRKLYGITYHPKNVVKNALGVVEYTPNSYVPEDLDAFFKLFAKDFDVNMVGARPINASIDGGSLSTERDFNYNGESDLDLEYAMALVSPINVTLYQTGDQVIGASFNNFLDALDGSYCAGDDPENDAKYPDAQPGGYNGPQSCGTYAKQLPKVVSTSYGYDELALSAKYEKRQCNEYMKLGLMGVTFVFSSGDFGVGSSDIGGNPACATGSGSSLSSTGAKFVPAFPASCPYVTTVGATEVYPGQAVTAPEGAANKVIYSGGGFSNVFPMPSYQSSAVSHYFKYHKPSYTSKQYNNTQKVRGYPDISANGVNYVVIVDGSQQLIFGTSASAPTVASIFTLINDARAVAGKKSIGFVNPTLYANPGMFNDIKFGNNPGCNTPGFKAEAGWDPVTGLGTPNFKSMMSVFMKLQ